MDGSVGSCVQYGKGILCMIGAVGDSREGVSGVLTVRNSYSRVWKVGGCVQYEKVQ